MNATALRTRGVRHTAARLATEVLAPWVWVLTLPLAVAWQVTGHRIGATLLWGLVVAVTGAIVPMVVIVRGARRGKWDSHHVTNREGRLIPFAVVFGSLGLGTVLLVVGDAPHQMAALAVGMLATLVVCIAVTFGARFKISIHAAVAAGAVVNLVLVYNPWLFLLTPLVVWVCWSRVALRDHTTAQVVLGAVVGVLGGGGGYWVLDLLLR